MMKGLLGSYPRDAVCKGADVDVLLDDVTAL